MGKISKLNKWMHGFYGLLFFLVLFAGAHAATSLSDEQIRLFLTHATVDGNQNGTEWTQTFSADGSTVYTQQEGRPTLPSEGYWRVQNSQYCSQWPPSQSWDCYNVSINGVMITFNPTSGGAAWPAIKRIE